MATSAADEPEIPAKNMLKIVTTCASPPRRCPTSVCDSVIMRTVTLADVMRSPTSRKNGTASSASVSMPLKSCAIIEARLTGVNAVTTSTDRDQREGHRHAHIAEEQEQKPHQEDEPAIGRHSDFLFSSASDVPAKPFFQPLTICSMMKMATSTPHSGMAA